MSKSEEYMQILMDTPKGEPMDRYVGFMFECHRAIESGRENIAEWTERLLDPERDPLYYMGWSDKAFEDAAKVFVHETVVRWIEVGDRNEQDKWAILHEIFNNLEEDVMRASKWPTQSTSPCTNLAAQMKLSAQAKFVEDRKSVFKDEPQQP